MVNLENLKLRKMKSRFYVYAIMVAAVLVASGGLQSQVALADELDDIESDMETTISESDAAVSEASAAKSREKEEQVNLQKAKSEAQTAMEKAKVKEADAKVEIKKIDARILALVKERNQNVKMKEAAEKRIVVVQQKIEEKKTQLTEAQALRDASADERRQQEENLAKLEDEKRGIEDEIKKARGQTAKNTTDIANMKKQAVQMEARLEILRKSAHAEAIKLEKSQLERDQAKRKIGSIPSRVVVRRSKIECAVTDEASDSGKTIGNLKKGHKYEIYRVIDKKWVYLQYGKSRGYAARTCF